MRRREFIALLGSTALVGPLAARAQQAQRIRRLGVLMSTAAGNVDREANIMALRDALGRFGWVVGKNLPPTPPPQGFPLRCRTERRKLAFELSGRFLGLHHVRGHVDQFGHQPIGALALAHVILPVPPRTLFEHGKLCLQHLDPRRKYGDRPGDGLVTAR
jgi:hypothetical protein